MAFQRSGASGSLRFIDRAGNSRTATIPFPDETSDGSAVTSAFIYAALDSWRPLIEAMSGLVCVGMSVSDNYYDDAADPTTSTTSANQVGDFAFYNLRQEKTRIRVPGFLETKLLTTGVPHVDDQQIIDNDDADVAAFVTAMVTGFDTTTNGFLRPGTDANAFVSGLAASDFKYVGSSSKRVSRG